ncbi:MAG TPA: Jag N-terminal domain-containing protein [Candidatus Polarisedimenticolaceae bacterium]|nr:Jag N-terminal domain-containing protein [Candidatus Polarisedimenticolaceae bacterium]
MTAEFEGRNLEEALAAAEAALGVPAASLRYELLEEGRRGILGLGAVPTRIRVLETPAPAAEAPASSPAVPERSPLAEEVGDTLETLLRLARLDLSVRATGTGSSVRLYLQGTDRRLLLQRDAELLGAFQVVLQRMARRRWPDVGSIQVDCEGGPRRREDEALVDRVRAMAEQVLRTGEPGRLGELNPYERRLVHLTVGSYPELKSTSEGEGFLKPILVTRVPKG